MTPSRTLGREFWLATVLFLLIGIGTYGFYALSAGFVIDDWGHAAEVAHPNTSLLNDYWIQTPNRPVLVLYVPLTFSLFGPHPVVHHIWSIVLAVAMSAALYAVLRQLTVGFWHAGFIAVLVLLFPWSDSVRLWATAGHINFAITLALCGVLLALHDLKLHAAGHKKRARFYHLGAAILYALSVLTYEVAGIALLMVGGLYLLRAPWRVIRTRWLVDVSVVISCLAWSSLNAHRVLPSLHEMLTHTERLADGALTIIARAANPFGAFDRLALNAVISLILVGAATLSVLPSIKNEVRSVLRRWLLIAGCGILVAIASWVLYIPADLYYESDAPGVGNRTNAMATLGVVTAIYATVALAAVMLFHRSSNWMHRANIVTIAVALLLTVSYANTVRNDQQAWIRASDEADNLLASVNTALPRVPPNSTLYTFNYPGSETYGVVIFAFSWDLNGAVQLLYDDQTVRGYPIIEGTTMKCLPDRLSPAASGLLLEGQGSSYGQAYFVDIPSATAQRIDSPRECQAAANYFTPGPVVRYSSGI